MFPYRRGNKKRGKGGSGLARRNRDGGGGGGGGRRVPTTAHELLPLLQPTTKALAQVLAGNTKASGQIVHARNILAQAERFIDERSVDRLIPIQREEFLEQVARLKLTLADAGADEIEAVAVEAEPKRVAPPVSMEQLRAVALRIASTPSEAEAASAPDRDPAIFADPEPEEEPAAEDEEEAVGALTVERAPRTDIPQGSPRSARLRLSSASKPPTKGREGRA
jgi:hypothetical protein